MLTLLKPMKTTTQVINKELISHLLMLESEQQESVLTYIKSLLNKNKGGSIDPVVQSKLKARAKASNEAIKAGRTKSIDQVRKEVKNW